MSAGVTGRFASVTFQHLLDVLTVEDSHRQGYLSLVGETAIVVGDRKELTYLLSQAAELEHGLMCEYLYAAFSLKSTAGPGLRADQLDSVGRWREMILGIAAEEMLHWAMVQNLLTAVGSAPYVSGPTCRIRQGATRPGYRCGCSRSARRRWSTLCTWSDRKGWKAPTLRASNPPGRRSRR
jgi:hypothetical protein